jgi:MtrB/PioB family decaheme-associated outer membrane protein
MKRKLIAVLVANAFVGSAVAADGTGLKVTGEVGLGLRYVNDNAADSSKLKEYRDLDTDPLTFLDIRADDESHRFNFFAENLTTDDRNFAILGQRYGAWKFRLYGNELKHHFGSGPGALSPFSGIGTNTLTAAPLNFNVNTWNPFDNSIRRRDYGVMAEWSAFTPWYLRLDANLVDRDGIRVIGGAKGTSPGNGSMEIPAPIDYKTYNYSVEGGYQGPREHFAVSWMQSKFRNDNEFVRWSNDFFSTNPLLRDTSSLPADNDMWRIAANGNIRGLPYSSTLAGRVTYSKVESDVSVLPSILSTGNTNPSTAANAPIFHGEHKFTTAALTLNSAPMRGLDTRFFYNYYDKQNDSTRMIFSPTAASGLQCGGGPCENELLGYTKHNPGFEAFYRVNSDNRVGGGYNYEHVSREDRFDLPKTRDHRFFAEWKNTTLDWLDARVRYQFLARRGGLEPHDTAGNPIDAFVWRYDAAPVDQHQVKFRFDTNPMPLVDVSLDLILKHNDYKNTVLGRTKDRRQEYYFTAGYGDINKFRVYGFADLEVVQIDSLHRMQGTPNDATANPGLGFSDPTTFNWSADNDDKSWQYGVGATWKQFEKLTWQTNALYVRTAGNADFAVPGAPPGFVGPGWLLPAWFDRTKRISFNLKGIYQHDRNWTFTGGYAYERYKYSDIGVDGFTYVLPPLTNQASYFTGEGAFQPYTVHIFYLMGQYKF